MVNKLLSQLVDGLFPFRCVLCDLPSHRSLPLCNPCQAELPYNRNPCPVCALPQPLVQDESQEKCGACLKRAPTYTHCLAPLLYADPVARFIQDLKYRQDMTMLPLLTELMATPVQQALATGSRPDYLLPMPLHWRRLWGRGYNQAERLAFSLSRHPALRPWALRVERRLCHRARATAPQQGLDRTQRHRNLLGAFAASPRVEGLHIAVIDDVVTTGASVEILAQALVDGGARRVDIWCCARTPPPRPGTVH